MSRPFLKIGSVLYGSGYVLLAFLRSDFVVDYAWLTEAQLIDAVAIGQVTPGPVFTTATFIGYVLGGLPGGLLATAGIFLPSFLFVAISNPLIPRIRGSVWAAGLLDGVPPKAAAQAVNGSLTFDHGDEHVDLGQPWRRATLTELVSEAVGREVSLDTAVGELQPDLDFADPPVAGLTLVELATHTSGPTPLSRR